MLQRASHSVFGEKSLLHDAPGCSYLRRDDGSKRISSRLQIKIRSSLPSRDHNRAISQFSHALPHAATKGRTSLVSRKSPDWVTSAAVAEFQGMEGTQLPRQFEPIRDEQHLDEILDEAKAEGSPVIIDWMAQWCRKCIYLKPKIEKLAEEFPKVRFCVVDVNSVPLALVQRGKISKMPTIQLWSNREIVDEVIGGEKAWQVLDRIRDMINNSK